MDESEDQAGPDSEEQAEQATEEPTGGLGPADGGVPWAAIALLVWAVALIVFAVQNADDTTIQFLAWEWTMPVAMVVMITALVTLVLTAIGSAVYRRRRRRLRHRARPSG